MYGFKAVITYWNPQTNYPNGHGEVEGHRGVVSLHARGALKRTRRAGIYEAANVSPFGTGLTMFGGAAIQFSAEGPADRFDSKSVGKRCACSARSNAKMEAVDTSS
jgi:hypothetical protein